MGGKRSGVSRKARTLPRRYTDGALARVDRRGAGVRAVLEGAQQIIEDRGGEAAASLLLRRAAHRTMHLDQLLAQDELRMTQGQPINQAAYLAGAQTWLRYANAIGLGRRAKLLPRALDYAAQVAAEDGAP